MRDIEPKKDTYAEGPSLATKQSKPRYPTMRLPLDAIPEAKKWDVVKEGESKGKEYTIELRVRMIGLSQGRFDQSAEFELRGIECGEMEGKGENEGG